MSNSIFDRWKWSQNTKQYINLLLFQKLKNNVRIALSPSVSVNPITLFFYKSNKLSLNDQIQSLKWENFIKDCVAKQNNKFMHFSYNNESLSRSWRLTNRGTNESQRMLFWLPAVQLFSKLNNIFMYFSFRNWKTMLELLHDPLFF